MRNLFNSFNPLILAVILFCGWSQLRCPAQTGTQREYELKAAVIYNLVKYVEWPAESLSNSPPSIQIGLLGELPFEAALHVALDGKTVQGRKLIIKRLSNLQQAGDCQVLFIAGSEKRRLSEIVGELKNRPILTVSEVEGFAERDGGMVNLVAVQNHINMEINREVTNQSRLTVSSQVLKLAKVFPR